MKNEPVKNILDEDSRVIGELHNSNAASQDDAELNEKDNLLLMTEVMDTMPQENAEKNEKDNTEAIARKIWLAGLGAYGRSFDEVQSRYEQMSDEGMKLFNELVVRGEELQQAAESKLDDTRDGVEQRIEQIKGRFSALTSRVNLNEKLDEISSNIDKINEKITKD